MRVVTEGEFRDSAAELLRSDDVILVMREGRPAGVFLSWRAAEPVDDVRRAVFLRLTEQIAAQREARGVTEQELLGDFATERARR